MSSTPPLTPEQHERRAADAYLAYRRQMACWSPPEPAPPRARPHRWTDAWRKDMHTRHRAAARARNVHWSRRSRSTT